MEETVDLYFQLGIQSSPSSDPILAPGSLLDRATRPKNHDVINFIHYLKEQSLKHELEDVGATRISIWYAKEEGKFTEWTDRGAKLEVLKSMCDASPDHPLLIVRPAPATVNVIEAIEGRLVVKPAAAAPAEESIQSVLRSMSAKLDRLTPPRENVSISNVNGHMSRLLSSFYLSEVYELVQPRTKEVQVQPFSWGDASETDHATLYIAWMNKNLLSEGLVTNKVALKGVIGETSLLSLHNHPRLPLDLSGTTDVLVYYSLGGAPSYSSLAVIEIKKPRGDTILTEKNISQTIAEMISADTRSSFQPFSVLTDLGNEWMIFWIGNQSKIYRTIRLSCEQAIPFIQDLLGSQLLNGKSDQYKKHLATICEPATKRIKLEEHIRKVVPMEGDELDESPYPAEMSEPAIIEEKMKLVHRLILEHPLFQPLREPPSSTSPPRHMYS